MEGVVKLVNEEAGVFVTETDDGFTVFEVADADDVEPGDVVAGSLDSTACEIVFNHTKDEQLEVRVRDVVATLEAAEALLHGNG